MRKSKSSTRTRLLRAGVAVGAVGAAALIAPQAAWAAGTTAPFVVPPNTPVTVTDSAYTYAGGNTVEISTAACAAHYTTPNNTSIWAGTSVSGASHSITATIPSSVPPNANGVAKTYNLCVYNSNDTALSTVSTTSTVAIAAALVVSPLAGPTGGGNMLNLTLTNDNPLFTGQTAVGTVFTTSNCPLTYGTPAVGMSMDANRLSNTQATVNVPSGVTTSTATPTVYNVCLYGGNTSSSALLSDVNYSVGKAMLSNTSGPTSGGNGITINSVSDTLFAGFTPGVVFLKGVADCTGLAAYAATGSDSATQKSVIPANLRKLADNRLALTVPVVTAGAWQACIYNNNVDTLGTLVASAAYSVAAPAVPTGVSPAAGPATGGTRITITGTGFPSDPGSISATLGGVPLNNIQPSSPTAFTAVTPPHSVDKASTLVMTTATGTKALQNAFAFQNSINVKPNTAPNTTTAVDVEVTGVGFLSYSFGATARVYLTDGAYDPSDVDPTGGTQKANGPIANCGSVLVVSDASLICTLALSRRLDETGSAFDTTIWLNVTNSTGPAVDMTAGSPILDIHGATGGSFSWKDLGQPIADGQANAYIPTGTIVTAVLSPTRLVMSKNALQTNSTPTVNHAVIGNATAHSTPVHTFTTSISTTIGSNQVTTTSSYPFSGADVGRVFYGAAVNTIPDYTTIIAVAPDGLSATLSAPDGSAALSAQTENLFPAAPVPNGAYVLDVVSNNAVDANTSDPAYQQSAVTSGSTFTVAQG